MHSISCVGVGVSTTRNKLHLFCCLRTKYILQGRAGACSLRFRPLREGAVKCTAFDWGRDFFISLPPSFACGKSHLPPRGRNNGSSRTPTPTHEKECVHPYKPPFIILHALSKQNITPQATNGLRGDSMQFDATLRDVFPTVPYTMAFPIERTTQRFPTK